MDGPQPHARDALAKDGLKEGYSSTQLIDESLPPSYRSIACGWGWPAFWIYLIMSNACGGFLGELIPGLGLRYFNNWQGDPCDEIGILSIDCQVASTMFLKKSSMFGMMSTLVVIFSSPAIGILSDSTGRLLWLGIGTLISFCALAAVAGMMWWKVSIYLFFWTSLLNGFIPVSLLSNLWITDRSRPEHRVILYGLMTAAFDGEGVVVPFVSAFLKRQPMVYASIICYGVMTVLLLGFVPESLPRANRQPFRPGDILSSWKQLFQLHGTRRYWLLVFMEVIVIGSQMSLSSNFLQLMKERFTLSRQQSMPMVTVYGIVSLCAQIIVVGPLNRFLGPRGVLVTGMVWLALGHTTLAFASSLALTWLALTLAGLGTVASPALWALITDPSVMPTQDRGRMLGVFVSATTALNAVYGFSFTRIHAYFALPRWGIAKPFPSAPLLITAALDLLALLLMPLYWRHLTITENQTTSGNEKKEDAVKACAAP